MTVTCSLLSEKAQAWIENEPKASFVNGAFVSRGMGTFPGQDPATTQTRCELSMGDATTVDQAVRAADDAFKAWRDTPPAERAACRARL